jgi:hypothetical protein
MEHDYCMEEDSIKIEYRFMDLKGFPDYELYVAKLERVSSAPIRMSDRQDNRSVALTRLTDIFRCGKSSRNYEDFLEVKKDRKNFGPLDPEPHWAIYVDRVLRAMQIDSLDMYRLGEPEWISDLPHSGLRVKYHHGRMNHRPYIVAGVGDILASPAAIWLHGESTRESALARLQDVFRIGKQGAAYQELYERRTERGQDSEDIQVEWDACQNAVYAEVFVTSNPRWRRPEWDICDRAVERECDWATILYE